MATELVFRDTPLSVIDTVDFGSMQPTTTLESTIIISHTGENSILVSGFYLKISDIYKGSTNSLKDIQDVLLWGSDFEMGLSLRQNDDLGLEHTDLFTGVVGSGVTNKISLLKNDGVIASRGFDNDEATVILRLEIPDRVLRSGSFHFVLTADFEELDG